MPSVRPVLLPEQVVVVMVVMEEELPKLSAVLVLELLVVVVFLMGKLFKFLIYHVHFKVIFHWSAYYYERRGTLIIMHILF